ncbi:class I SAM-dependent methyltransferase [Nocardioides limicola]|uniref:class I SAM-dependent methyltransferase n=1 Tax=Nocardioides limicola TaxID=2803368 RepID=UPI00193C137C|nr:methyltransferase domain-containing protein [Nocardioides sp. DJM-14]
MSTGQLQGNPARAYEEYFVPAIFDPLSAHTLRRAALTPGEQVLDLACGTGIIARLAAPLVGAGGRVLGADLNPAMIEVAREVSGHGPGAPEFVVADATALDLPGPGFDAVICQQGLQFFADRAEAVQRMRHLLRDSGRLVVATWQSPERHPFFQALAEVEAPLLAEVGLSATPDDLLAPFSFGDADALGDLLTANGCSTVEVEPASITAHFADADRFIERQVFAYVAVVPAFGADPAAFTEYARRVAEATRDLVDTHRVGDHIAVPMHTQIAVATG